MLFNTGTSEDELGQELGLIYQELSGKPIKAPYRAIGIVGKDKYTKGVIILCHYTDANIEMHVHAPKCFNRAICIYIFNYIFEELGCLRLTTIPQRKHILTKMLPRMGFIYEGTLKQFYGPLENQDGIILTLFKNNIPDWAKLNAKRSKYTESA